MGTPQVMASSGVFGLSQYNLQPAFERDDPAATSERPEETQEGHTPETDRTGKGYRTIHPIAIESPRPDDSSRS
jgi:hypothetical protein